MSTQNLGPLYAHVSIRFHKSRGYLGLSISTFIETCHISQIGPVISLRMPDIRTYTQVGVFYNVRMTNSSVESLFLQEIIKINEHAWMLGWSERTE